MKSKWIYILILMLFTSIQLYGQNAGNREEIREAPMANLEFTMQSSSLNTSQLTSFGKRAVQKMEDAVGYLALMKDTSLDEGFRERAEQLALQAFTSIEAFSGFVKKSGTAGELEKVLLHTPFQEKGSQNGSSYFEGKLALSYAGNTTPLIVAAYLYKQPKQFGKEVSYVWEVKLGSQ